MLRVNKLINNCTTTWLYETHELYFKFPSNDLPLFISRVRQNTLGRIRSVKLQYNWDQCLALGLRLLYCCKEVRSLKISSEGKLPQYYLAILKQIRVETFEHYGPWVQKLEETGEIMVGKTKPTGRLAKLPREEIVGNSDR